jgi:hypothetical protein
MMITFRFPSYCRPNIWPTDDLPELQTGIAVVGHIRHILMSIYSKDLKKYVGICMFSTIIVLNFTVDYRQGINLAGATVLTSVSK